MIEFVTAAALILSLTGPLVAVNRWRAARIAPRDTPVGGASPVPFPCEFLPHVFSHQDWEFVRELNSVNLKKLFLRERKAVALTWLAETSAALKVVMHEHALAARHSTNLNPLTELRLLARYISLLLLCGLLAIAIRVVGPARLGGIAHLTQHTFERLAESHRALLAPAQRSDAFAGVRN